LMRRVDFSAWQNFASDVCEATLGSGVALKSG
jgi:hypothetical protein